MSRSPQLLFRGLPVWHGKSVLQLQGGWKAHWLALAMVVVSVVALSTEAVVAAVARAARDHAPLLRSLIDETRGAFGLTAALSTTGALIALAERPLGIVAIPLFLFPLLLTQFAVRRYATVRATYRQTIRALSRLTESRWLHRGRARGSGGAPLHRDRAGPRALRA